MFEAAQSPIRHHYLEMVHDTNMASSRCERSSTIQRVLQHVAHLSSDAIMGRKNASCGLPTRPGAHEGNPAPTHPHCFVSMKVVECSRSTAQKERSVCNITRKTQNALLRNQLGMYLLHTVRTCTSRSGYSWKLYECKVMYKQLHRWPEHVCTTCCTERQ